MFNLQPWHITNQDALVLQKGTGELDRARGYYDPDHNEVVITLEASNPRTGQIDPGIHRLVIWLLREQWGGAYVRSEVE
jgi:hypothetical protein